MCIHICIHRHTQRHRNMYRYISYIDIYVSTYLTVCAQRYICILLYIHGCICICICICICLCICIGICICYVCVHVYVNVICNIQHKCCSMQYAICMCVCLCTCICMYIYILLYIFTYIYMYVFVYVFTKFTNINTLLSALRSLNTLTLRVWMRAKGAQCAQAEKSRTSINALLAVTPAFGLWRDPRRRRHSGCCPAPPGDGCRSPLPGRSLSCASEA